MSKKAKNSTKLFKPGDKVKLKDGLVPVFAIQLENGLGEPIRHVVGKKEYVPDGWRAVVDVRIDITFETEKNGVRTKELVKLGVGSSPK